MADITPRLAISHEKPVTVVELLDEEILEEGTINDIQESLFAVVHDNPGIRLVLSFVRVKHLSSSALGTLIRLNKRIEETKGKLALCEIKPALYEVFVITRLSMLFNIFETRSEAISSLSSPDDTGG